MPQCHVFYGQRYLPKLYLQNMNDRLFRFRMIFPAPSKHHI
ncbi:hypothetical protein V6Z12_A05G136300 [Gossypium hirsutum]